MEEKKKTVGQMMYETQAEHDKTFGDNKIEVGEVVEDIGNKQVMVDIWKAIHARADLPQWKEKYYIVLFFKKHAILHRVLEANIHCRHSKPSPEPSLTLFSYDPILGDKGLKLEWVLPRKGAFELFLKNRETTDPFLMKCIDQYLSGKLK